MHKNLKLLFLLTIPSLFSLSGLANEEIEEEIVVVASRTPTLASEVIGSVTSISQADIELQMIDGLEQLVRFIPGVSSQKESQYGRALTEDVQIRGIQGGGIFLIDGVRISDSYVGYGRDTVDTDLLKKVEILKGPSSVEYGSDGLAGTVAYFTKDPSDLAEPGERYLSVSTAYDGVNNQEKINLLAAYSGDSNEGLIQLVDRKLEEIEIHDGFSMEANPLEAEQQSLIAKFISKPNENLKISLVADIQEWEGKWEINSEQGFVYFPSPRSISSSAGDDEGTRERFTVRLDTAKGNAFYDQANISIYSQETEQSQITVQNQVSFYNGMQAAPTPSMRIRDFDFNQSIDGFVFEAFKTNGMHQMVYGLDFNDTDTERPRMLTEINLITNIPTNTVDGETYPNKTFPDSETKRKALFFNDRISISSNQILNLGFRYDEYELNPKPDALLENANILNYQVNNIKDDAFSLKLGYLYDFNDQLTGYAQYAEGFKAPNYENSNIVFTNYLLYYTVVPNPNLDSETSKSYEIGLRGNKDDLSWEMALYRNKVDGFIRYEVIGFSQTGLGIYQYNNVDNVEINGFELDLQKRVSDNFSLNLALSSSSGDEIKSNGEVVSLAEIDPKEMVLGLNWNSTNEVFGLKTMFSLVERSDDDFEPVCLNNSCDPRVAISGYGLIDLFAFYRPNENLNFGLAIENLTDKKYHRWASVSRLPANDDELDLYGQSGRSISASFKYTF